MSVYVFVYRNGMEDQTCQKKRTIMAMLVPSRTVQFLSWTMTYFEWVTGYTINQKRDFVGKEMGEIMQEFCIDK